MQHTRFTNQFTSIMCTASHLWSRISTKSTRVLHSHKWIFISLFVQTVVSDNSSLLYGLVVLSQFWFLHQSHVRSNCQNHLVTISALHFRRLWFCSTGTVSITSTLLSPPALPSFCSVQIRSIMNPVFPTTPVFEMPTLLKTIASYSTVELLRPLTCTCQDGEDDLVCITTLAFCSKHSTIFIT